jgi:hypothetical protein
LEGDRKAPAPAFNLVHTCFLGGTLLRPSDPGVPRGCLGLLLD